MVFNLTSLSGLSRSYHEFSLYFILPYIGKVYSSNWSFVIEIKTTLTLNLAMVFYQSVPIYFLNCIYISIHKGTKYLLIILGTTTALLAHNWYPSKVCQFCSYLEIKNRHVYDLMNTKILLKKWETMYKDKAQSVLLQVESFPRCLLVTLSATFLVWPLP